MERMLVVVFDNEAKAAEGKAALRQLEMEGSVAVYAGAVVVKQADGTAGVKQIDDMAPIGGLLGTSVGSLIGLLGGPVGLAIGAVSGLTLGAMADLDNARVGEDFVVDVQKFLEPGKVALVAEVDEEWTAPVDTRMEALGGTVLRRALWEVEEKVWQQDIAAMEADLTQLKAEMAQAHAERRAKLQKKVDQLQATIDSRKKEARLRMEAFQARQKSKRQLLKKNAATAGRALKELAKTPV